MSKVDKRGAATIMLLASIVKRSIDKTMPEQLDTVEDKASLDKTICSEVVNTLTKKDK